MNKTALENMGRRNRVPPNKKTARKLCADLQAMNIHVELDMLGLMPLAEIQIRIRDYKNWINPLQRPKTTIDAVNDVLKALKERKAGRARMKEIKEQGLADVSVNGVL